MTTYTAIPNSDVDQDSPVTQTLVTLLRDNPIAITEGASGAPKIQSKALNMFLGEGVGPHTDLGDIAKVVVFASMQIRQIGDDNSTCSVQYRLSSDNGSSWGSWVTFKTIYQYSNTQRENGMGLDVIDMGPTYNAVQFQQIDTNGIGSATFVALGVVGVS